MFKSARSRLRAAVFACAAALGLGAYAATPIAVWDGNFSESATINGATFNANGNTVAEDGSYVKITGEKGAVFTLNKSYRYITAVFTVSNLNETAAYDRALATVGGGTLFGAYLQSGTLTTHGINGNAIWPTANASDYSSYDATLTSYADAETRRTFSLTQAHSSNSYSGTHLYEVYGGDTAAAIKFGGSGNNGLRAGQAYSKVVIGGMESYTEGTTLFKAASDLVILKVALYASDSTFPIAQADYATYSMPSMTVVTTPSTMSALNTAVAASSDAVALSDVSATITLDEEPSGATKSILQSAYWRGTVLIKDADKNNIVPSNYGNPNSTLKLSGVKGYFAAQQFNSSATPAIELEDSETDGREYGLWQNNGYSFYSGTSGTYQYMNTPELKGSGTYKIDTAETSSLFVADKFSNFTGKLEVTYGAVWLGVAVPSRDVAGRELVKVGTVRVSEAFVNAPLSQWTGWTVANGYLGDITVAAGSTNNYTDNRVNFLKADSWKGTMTISAATNNTNGHIEIWLSKLGGANSTIVINDLVSGSKDYYLNEGNYQNNPTFVSTIDINGDVQFKNGSSSQTVTFDKVTSDSATDKLTFAFPTSATLNFKINSLDNFAGTISASSSTPLTISNITSTAALGTALVKVDATNKNIASLDATELNGTSTNLCVDTVNDVSGIYIAAAIIGSTGYATVQNAIDALGSDPTDAQLATVSVADANATIPDGYKVENGVISKDVVPTVTITVPEVANTTVTVANGGETIGTAAGNYEVAPGSVVTVTYAAESGYAISGTTQYTIDTTTETTFEITDTATAQYVARVRNYGTNQNEDFTSLNAAIAVADGTTYANSITLLADITDAVTIDKAISLAGQGRTISAAVTISSGGYLLLMGPTLTGKLTIGANGAFAVTGTGSVLPEVETQDGASIALRTLSADTVALTVTTLTVNGTLTLSSTAQGTVRGTPYKAFSYVTANATFGEGAEIVGDGEYSASTEDEGDNTVVSMTITAVAKIGDEYYDDLDEAVADAIANDTVVDLLIQPAAAVTLGVGQTLKVKAYSYTLEVNLASGLTNPPYSISSALNIDTTITTYTVNVAFAKIGNTTYPTLAAAIEAATSGDTVTLLADVTLDASLAIPAGKSLTLNLNGYTLTGPSGNNYAIANSGNITLTGGTITGYGVARNVASGATITVTDGTYTATGANGFINLTDTVGCAVTINGGTFTAQEAVVATGRSKNSSITVNGGTLTSIDNAVLMDNGSSGYTGNTIIVTGGTLNGGITTAGYVACGIYCANDTTVNVTGGTFNITGGCGILARAGKVSVSGTTVINTTGTATGKVGDSRIVVPCAPIVYDSAANYPGYDETTTEFAVSGGTFTANGEDVDCIVQVADEGDATSIAVSGGTFNTAVADTYCAEGFEPKDNGNGTYGVRVDKGWIYEDADFPNYTGSWNKEISYDETTHKAAIEDGATYTASKPSAGQLVTINLALSFDAANSDDDVHEGAKTAVRLGEGDTEGTYVFQLYTTNETGTAAWLNAAASDVTPTIDQDYAFTFVLDMTNKTFTATVDGVALTVDGAETLGFASANASDTVQSIEFTGSGKVASIQGSYEDVSVPEGFAEDDTFGDVTLTAAQAEWLNGQNNYPDLAAKIKTMDATAFNDAYLLNLDILDTNSDYTFAVKGIVVGEDKVDVTVMLTRSGALTENEKAKPIVGTLKLKGTASLGTDFTVLGETAVDFDANANFSDGATETTVTVDTTETDAKFYLPVIE